MTPLDLLFAWPRWLAQSVTRPLADLRDLVDVDLSNLIDVNIQSGGIRETGDPGIERNVYSSVARPGKQLGCIADAVLELAKKTGHADGENVEKLSELVNEIEKVKKRTAESRAAESLAYLRKTDPDGFRRLIERERGELRSAGKGASVSTGGDTGA